MPLNFVLMNRCYFSFFLCTANLLNKTLKTTVQAQLLPWGPDPMNMIRVSMEIVGGVERKRRKAIKILWPAIWLQKVLGCFLV